MRTMLAVALAVAALPAPTQGRAGELSVAGLTLTLDAGARVTGIAVDGKPLEVQPAPLATLCDVSKGAFEAPTVTGGELADGLSLRFAKAAATATLTVTPRDSALRFTCRLKGDKLPARGMLLRFAFPFDATGWRWHNDMQTSVAIGESKVYENVRPLRAWADLPEWSDQPDLRMGYSNRNFCTVVTGPAGLCLAVPIDKPCIFRTAYDAQAKRLELVYDFALSPDTREPNQVAFAFDLYRCDPHWAFRDALARYYRLYPELFRAYVKEPGQWMAFSRLSEIDNANEYCFGLQEGAPEPEYDDQIGVLSAPYLTHAGQFARIPNHDPETEPLPPFERQLEAMDAAFKRRTRRDGVYRAVGLHNADGTLDIRKTRVYGHIIAQFNLDPELPYGKWTLDNAVARTESVRKSKNATLDGFYYDGLSAGINYRRDHFRTADAPCLWDPVAKKPLLNNFFSSCEFARAAAELLRPRGQVTMMNGALGASFYVAPWLDLLGAETGLRISRERLNYIRATTYHKPFLTLLKGNYEQKIGRAEIELFMKRCLAYGIFPGFFDWPPSGLGPGGRYWDHARYTERDRDLHRTYQPLCRALAMAGWEPVTYARTSEPNVFVERFGPTPDGILWLTLLNEDAQPHTTVLAVAAERLGLDPAKVRAIDVLSGTAIPMAPFGGVLLAELEVPADGVMAIQIAEPDAAVRWRLQQAIETLDRGIRMREVDRDKPPIAVHWRPRGTPYGREFEGSEARLVLAGDHGQSASQWAMLFQPKPTPVTLRVRASGRDLEGNKGSIGIRCRIAWVTRSFTHYETRFFDLPTGTYDWRDLEFTIRCDRALRSIQVMPTIGRRVKGTLRLARISLSDATRDDYVIDPEFKQWYEPIPADRGQGYAQQCRALRQSLSRLASVSDFSSDETRQALLAACGRPGTLTAAIGEASAHKPWRRLLRDLETAERHLGWAALCALRVSPPSIQGPTTATPGDTVSLTYAAPALPGIPSRMTVSADGPDLQPADDGGTLTVPADAKPGSTIRLSGQLRIGESERPLTLRFSHTITVVPPMTLSLGSQGVDTTTGAVLAQIRLRNHRSHPLTARLAIQPPDGWQAQASTTLAAPPFATATALVRLEPSADATPGPVDLRAQATDGGCVAQASLTILHIPNDANLLRNPGFEQGTESWSQADRRSSVDTTVSRSGKAAIRLHNPSTASTQASQTVRLDQKTPCAILVRAASKAKGVSGGPGKGYSLYVDIYYTDGTPRYGITHNFATGTADWQLAELYIEPAKPIRNVNVYLLLRGKSGTAWFDDVAVMEDPRRKGNIARDARVSVDSSYSKYDATPINDGIIQVEGLHWTKEAWASADNDTDHSIALEFAQPRTIATATVYWSLDAGVPRTSREVRLQVAEGDGWRTVATAKPERAVPYTVLRCEEPARAKRFRFFQPKGSGPAGRPGLMWVREVELAPPTPR